MTLQTWIASKLPDHALLIEAQRRSFVLGKAVVNPSDEAWGHDSSEFGPEEYGNYIATSNGVYACATQRAQFLASLPLKFYKVQASGKRIEVTSGPLIALMQKVNPFWTLNRLMQMTELARCLWGQSFWFLERGKSGKGQPQEIWWGRPDRVSVIPDTVNYIAGYSYEPLTGVQPLDYGPQEVIWSKFPNPLDEYSGLSPLAAARLSADYASSAMKSNKLLFDNGIQAGGFVAPKGDTIFDATKAREAERIIDQRMKGVDKAHRWSVFTFDAEFKSLGVSPKDAEFINGMALALEDIARAFKWPLDLIGGTNRTYANVSEARKAAWTGCVLPEAAEIASDISEQLLPMFPGQADICEFDSSGVHELQEDKQSMWTMWSGQIEKGAKTINEYRAEQGLEPVPWGDSWWAPLAVAPIRDGSPAQPEPTLPATQAATVSHQRINQRAPEYGSADHERISRRAVERIEQGQAPIRAMVVDLFERQRSSVINRLKQSGRTAEQAADEPFDQAQWVKEFRTSARPVLKKVVQSAAEDTIKNMGIGLAFDVSQPAVARFIERRAQRFAQRVNETTWDALKKSLGEGFDAGEGVNKLMERIDTIMDDRIRSSSETIARTESLGANSGADLEVWRQSEVVTGRTWISAFALRSREDHTAAHGQTVDLDAQFDIGGVLTDGPGLSGVAEIDINCLCTTIPEVAE